VRRKSLGANTVFNLGGALVPLCVSIVVIPLYLVRIGQARYGIISLVWLLFGYFGLFDLGLSQATTNLLARPTNQIPVRQAEIFWTATAVNIILGIVGGTVFALLGNYILGFFVSIPVELKAELHAALTWVACLLPLSTTGAVFVGALEAHERFLELNIIQVIGAICSQLLPLLAVIVIGPRIENAIAATFVARLATTVPIFILAVRQCGRGFAFKLVPSTAHELFRYGGWITVSNIVGPILVSIDQFMIGAVIGVASVPRYSIPFNFATKILLVPTAMTRALFPKLTRLGMHDAVAKAESLTVSVSLALVLVCAPLILLNHGALTLWLGAEFAAGASILSRIIIVGVWINGLAYVPYVTLQSQGMPSVTAKLHMYELLPFFALLWLGLHYIGLIGAALAWSSRVLIDAIFLFKAAKFTSKTAKNLLPSLCIMGAAFGLSLLFDDEPLVLLGISWVIFGTCLIYAVRTNAIFSGIYLKYFRIS
jgi:O-antigen/teichoic acid export membrane protein